MVNHDCTTAFQPARQSKTLSLEREKEREKVRKNEGKEERKKSQIKKKHSRNIFS